MKWIDFLFPLLSENKYFSSWTFFLTRVLGLPLREPKLNKKIYEYKDLEIRNGKALLGNLVPALASSWGNVVPTAFPTEENQYLTRVNWDFGMFIQSFAFRKIISLRDKMWKKNIYHLSWFSFFFLDLRIFISSLSLTLTIISLFPCWSLAYQLTCLTVNTQLI